MIGLHVYLLQWSALLTMSCQSDGLTSFSNCLKLYVEQFEHLALSTYLFTGLLSWYTYVDDIIVVLHSDENVKFHRHINVDGQKILLFCCNPKSCCQDAYIGVTFQQLQHRRKQQCRYIYQNK